MNADGSNQAVVVQGAQGDGFAFPSWSPDATHIAFDAQIGGVSGIWITDVTVVNGTPVGSNLRRIPINLAGGQDVWSPRSCLTPCDTIAFTRDASIYVVLPTGGTPTIAYTSPQGLAPSQFDWSPDASQLVIMEATLQLPAQWSLVVFDRRSSTRTVIVPLGGFFVRYPAWSRGTANLIAYSGYSGNNPEAVYTLASTGGTPVKVTDGRDPTWSPDNAKIAFFGSSGHEGCLCTLTFPTGAIQALAGGGRNPDWRRF
jgi:Tol biopolymer transport system component